MSLKETVVFGEASESENEECESPLDTSDSTGSRREEKSYDRKRASGLLSLSSTSSTVISKLLSYQTQNQNIPDSPGSSANIRKDPNALPLLHKTLYTKNQQLYHCLCHLLRHPYEQAAKDLHIISQRLVDTQKILQNVDALIVRLKRELLNS